MSIQVEIREHLVSTTESPKWLAVVTSKGYSYYVVYVDIKPSEELIKKLWKEDKKAFSPYYS